MIAASSLTFPGTKPLAVWANQLAPFDPQALWVGHLLLHRAEVLVDVESAEAVDSLTRLVLRAVALDQQTNHHAAGHDWVASLERRIHFEAAVIHRIVHSLQVQGLLDAIPALTPAGRHVLERGSVSRQRWQRRQFAFMERIRPDGQRLLAPHFVDLHGGHGPAWHPDDVCQFRLDWLKDCLGQPDDWKERHAFAREVLRVADPAATGDDPPTWQRIVVDRPERLLLVLIAAGPDQRLLGFAARQESWELEARTPILTLPWSAREAFPDLAAPANPAHWKNSWLTWCKTRAPLPGIDQCTPTAHGCRLDVRVPEPLHRHLTASKHEILKGETWLLAGDGYLRSAARVQVESQGDSR